MVAKLGAAGTWGASGAIGGFSSRQVARTSVLAAPIRAARAMVRQARMGKASGPARVEPCLRTSRATVVHCVTAYLAGRSRKMAGPECCEDPTRIRTCGARGEARTRQCRARKSGGSLHPLDGLAPQARPGGAGLHPGSLGEVAEPAGIVLLEPGDCL